MVRRTVECTECGTFRAARDKNDEIVPFRDSCPNCGSTAFADAVDGR